MAEKHLSVCSTMGNANENDSEKTRFAAALVCFCAYTYSHTNTKLNGKLMRKHSNPPKTAIHAQNDTHTYTTNDKQSKIITFIQMRMYAIHSHICACETVCYSHTPICHPTSSHFLLPYQRNRAVFVMYAQFYHFNGFVIYLHATQAYTHSMRMRTPNIESERDHVGCHSCVHGPTEEHTVTIRH